MSAIDEARAWLKPGSPFRHDWAFDWSRLPRGVARELLDEQPARVFDTSGTSGQPKVCLRSGAQLALELEVTADLIPGVPDAVHATVNPASLYGFVGTFIGAHLGVITVFDEWGIRGTPLIGDRPLVFTVPASWRRLARALATARFEHITVVHAGATLPRGVLNAIENLGRDGRADLIDLFGATETGVIGSRQVFPVCEPVWMTVPDTQLVFPPVDDSGEARPTVTGPRVTPPYGRTGDPRSVLLDDWLVPTGPRSFGFAGRRERIVKPGGHAIDLDLLEEQIGALLPMLDTACVPVAHPELGEQVEVLVVGSPGIEVDVMRVLRRAAAHSLAFVPGSVKPVDYIPRSPMGKVRRVLSKQNAESAA